VGDTGGRRSVTEHAQARVSTLSAASSVTDRRVGLLASCSAARSASADRGGGSGLRDLAAEGLEGDGVRLGATATPGVQAVDRGHLVGGKLHPSYWAT